MLGLLGLIVASGAKAQELIPFSARYTTYKAGLPVARSEVDLQLESGRYQYRSRTEPRGVLALFRDDVIREFSTGEWSDDGIRPREYRYIHENSRKDRDVHLEFEWSREQVLNHAGGTHWRMTVPPHTLDKFSVQLALMLDLGRRPEGRIEYDIADGGKLKRYSFVVTGEQNLRTAAGEFHTLVVKRERSRDKRKRRSTTLWLAPELNYLPVRVEHHGDGGRFRMDLESVEGVGTESHANRKRTTMSLRSVDKRANSCVAFSSNFRKACNSFSKLCVKEASVLFNSPSRRARSKWMACSN